MRELEEQQHSISATCPWTAWLHSVRDLAIQTAERWWWDCDPRSF